MYRSMDRWMDGWMDAWMDGGMDGGMDRWMDGCMDGWRDGWMEGGREGWVDGYMDGYMDGWMDGCKEGGREGRWGEWEGEWRLECTVESRSLRLPAGQVHSLIDVALEDGGGKLVVFSLRKHCHNDKNVVQTRSPRKILYYILLLLYNVYTHHEYRCSWRDLATT